MTTPDWWEDPDLAVAVAEVEEFVSAAGWDQSPQLFALVATADLIAAEPSMATSLTSPAVLTPIAQEPLPPGDLGDAIAGIAWPERVAGCVLVQEIVVLPPAAATGLPADPGSAAHRAAEHPDRTEARLAAGVLRDGRGAACLLRVRGQHARDPLRGADLAPNLIAALRSTFLH